MLALSSAIVALMFGRGWAPHSRTVIEPLALLNARESAVGLRTIAPRVVARRRPSARDACAVVALGWPLSSAIVALLCNAGRPMNSRGCALLDVQRAHGCVALVAAAQPCVARKFHDGGRRPAVTPAKLRRCRDG
ncbi:hypothetical protein F511_08712 [Dorcoceras hygrometricum]|uniref:Secreted protein n=1 Tax=Dorcoceras hygrometricum TaxID=472368 RepID=A0A2Z7BXJ0_9LAMI|nr:hypothetical protein F511_08712 [Dorcoceras hygrometricum]